MVQERFHASIKEMNRRAKAFTSLVCCWIIGLIIVIALSTSVYRQAMILFTCMLGMVLLVMWLYTMYYLYLQHSNVIIQIHDSYLMKAGRFIRYKIDLRQLQIVKIKYTTRNSVRRMVLVPRTGNKIVIDGLDDFDKLVSIINNTNPSIKTVKQHERIDYDHVLFYPFFSVVLTALVSLTLLFLLAFVINPLV
jgi:hypothetical protein